MRAKNPALFRIFDERNTLKFKSLAWMKQQALKKTSSGAGGGPGKNQAHMFKHLKQILLNFDPTDEHKSYSLANPQSTIQNAELGPVYNLQKGSYMSIDSGISVRLPAKYCDFTGFPGKYKHKVNTLRFTEDRHYMQMEKM